MAPKLNYLFYIGDVWSVAFSFDGLYIASGSSDETVCLIDAYIYM